MSSVEQTDRMIYFHLYFWNHKLILLFRTWTCQCSYGKAEKWADKRAQVANPHGDSEVELGFSDEECDGDFKKILQQKKLSGWPSPSVKSSIYAPGVFQEVFTVECHRGHKEHWTVAYRESGYLIKNKIIVENAIFWRFIQFHFCVLLLICHVKSVVEQVFKHNLVLDNYFVSWKKIFRLFA